MRDNFLEKLIKAGGEGSRGGKIIGHDKSGKPIYASADRKPYPGEDTKAEDDALEPVKNMDQRKRTFMPPEGTTHHYSDSPNLRAYKNIIRGFKQKGLDFSGHLTYDPKTDHVIALTPKAKEVADAIVKDLVAEKKIKKKEE